MSSDSKIEISTKLLRRLHRIHRQRADLGNQIERGPRQLKAGEALLAKASDEFDNARETLKKATVASDEKQLQLSSRELAIEELERKLNSAASNREFSTLKEQIAADKQANSVLSDEILEALEQLEVLDEKVKQAEAELSKQKSEHESRRQQVEANGVTLRAELDRVEAELAETETEIPKDAIKDYKRLTDARGEEALAPVDSESCGGCFHTLTVQYIEWLRMSRLTRCPNCNAYLYFPEDQRVK
jgi:predicted  nucleic acid-binding Zn-ribbon protein